MAYEGKPLPAQEYSILDAAEEEAARLGDEEYEHVLSKMMENPDLVTLLRPLMAYDMGATHKMRWIEADNEYTTQVLYRLGFQWPPTTADYVRRFVETIIGFDYFNVQAS